MADKRRKWNRNLCAEREKSREYKRKKDSENRAKNGGNRNSYPAEAMAVLLKTASDVRLFLIGATVLLALILMTFTTGGYLEERMHATSVLASAIGSLAAIPVLWKQYKKDEGMFPKPEKRWSAAEAAACILLVMTFGHLLNTVMNVTGFTRIFSGYQDMASKIYEGQNPLLLILSVGVLSAAAEEIVFRGMIYRRAKDFWGTGWGIAASCLLFGAYHGNVTQFVYAAVVSVLLILIYERCGTLLAPVLAHMAENILGTLPEPVRLLDDPKSAGRCMDVHLFGSGNLRRNVLVSVFKG